MPTCQRQPSLPLLRGRPAYGSSEAPLEEEHVPLTLSACSELSPKLKAQEAGPWSTRLALGSGLGRPPPLTPALNRSLSGLVHIWSLQTRRAIATLDGHGGQCVIWLQTLPQGHQLLRYVSVVVPKEPGCVASSPSHSGGPTATSRRGCDPCSQPILRQCVWGVLGCPAGAR